MKSTRTVQPNRSVTRDSAESFLTAGRRSSYRLWLLQAMPQQPLEEIDVAVNAIPNDVFVALADVENVVVYDVFLLRLGSAIDLMKRVS